MMKTIEPDYLGALYTWLAFFALIGIFLLPAFYFKSVASRNNKKGWLFFLIGLGVGVVSFSVARIAAAELSSIKDTEFGIRYANYLWIPFFVIPYVINIAAMVAFKAKIIR